MFFAPGVGKDFEPSTSKPCHQFEFPEILIATENFDESLVIGSGGFGKVYKGNIIYGASLVVVAIKRLDPESSQGVAEFWSEVEMLSTLHHYNIVSLIGYCNHEKEKILLYEYMPNRTLHDHLHKLRTPLSWVMRLKICIDAGCGLRFLHNETGIDSGIIHRDVKSSNILLDENWVAKISDFGLSKTCPTNQPSTYVKTHVKGSFGYFDPSYYHTGMLTRKSDVYAFGVVLLEVLCRKRAVDGTLDEDQWSLVGWVQDSIKEGKLKHIIDSNISGEISPKCLKEFVKLADRCLQDNPKQRPTMVEVVASLENALNLQERFIVQPAGNRTIFGKMADMLPFPFNGEKSENYDDSIFLKMKEVPAHFQSPNLFLKEYRVDDLKKATKNFSPNLLLGMGGFGKVFLGWVEQNALAPSKQGVGIAIAVKRLHEEGFQRHAEWLMSVPLFVFVNGVVSPTITPPPVTTLLQSHPGAYTTFRTHKNGSELVFYERHLRRLATSAKILYESKLLFQPGITSSSLQQMKFLEWESIIPSFVNDSMTKSIPFALKERKCETELAFTAPVTGNLGDLIKDKRVDEEDIYRVFDMHLHVSLYDPVVFGVKKNGAHLAVVGRGRNVANAKYSDWVRIRKPLEKLRPPSTTELLLSNDGDQILEGCLTNFFVLSRKDNLEGSESAENKLLKNKYGYSLELQTAPISDGVLPGVVREVVIEICLKIGIPIREVAPSWSKRHLWEEAFITNSLRLLQHVETIRVPSSWNSLSSKTWKEVTWEEKQFEEGPGSITSIIQEEVLKMAKLESQSAKSFL